MCSVCIGTKQAIPACGHALVEVGKTSERAAYVHVGVSATSCILHKSVWATHATL